MTKSLILFQPDNGDFNILNFTKMELQIIPRVVSTHQIKSYEEV